MLFLLACSAYTPKERVEPAFIEVSLDGFAAGSREAPLPFTIDAFDVPITVRTLDVNGAPYAFEGDLKPKVRPGVLESEPWISISGGEWSGSVSIRNGFGPTRIWLTDEGDKDEDSGRAASWGAGVSEAIWFESPTIAGFQTTDDPETNQLAGEFATIRVADRQVVVTAREAAGFWVTDIMDAPGTYNSVYVYTFSRPDDAYAVGARVTLLTGIDQEYLASTQLSFPTLETDGTTLEVPAAFELTSCGDDEMEGLEGSRVRVSDGEIADTFVEGGVDYEDFLTYGQWPLSFGSCTVYVESGSTALEFDPSAYAGQVIPGVEGMVKQIFGKWVLVVVDAEDIETGAAGPTKRGI
ncbi:MAG: hypothetical protein Q8P41_21905 [Pseudomonadota bacterium]|nr:hypothetical protein [Pseudomonadota bacterium]